MPEGLKGQIAWLKERKRAIEGRIKRLEASSHEEGVKTSAPPDRGLMRASPSGP